MNGTRTRPKMFRTVSQGTARAFVVLALLSVLMSVAAGVIAVRAVQGEIRAKASIVQLCHAGNDSRAQQVTLWTHVVQISAPPPRQAPAERQRRDKLTREFLAYVRKVFMQRNCATSFKG